MQRREQEQTPIDFILGSQNGEKRKFKQESAHTRLLHVFDEQHTRAGRNTQPSTKSKKLTK